MRKKIRPFRNSDVYGIPLSKSKYIYDLETEKIYKKHYEQNRRIRKSRKEIIKPDLDELMDKELSR